MSMIFLDEGSHYSLEEGARATGKPVVYFRNRDLGDLEVKVEKTPWLGSASAGSQ